MCLRLFRGVIDGDRTRASTVTVWCATATPQSPSSERNTGYDPVPTAWQAVVLPLTPIPQRAPTGSCTQTVWLEARHAAVKHYRRFSYASDNHGSTISLLPYTCHNGNHDVGTSSMFRDLRVVYESAGGKTHTQVRISLTLPRYACDSTTKYDGFPLHLGLSDGSHLRAHHSIHISYHPYILRDGLPPIGVGTRVVLLYSRKA